MNVTLKTKYGTRIAEVTELQYYSDGKGEVAFIWGVNERGHECQYKPDDLEPQREVERVIKEMRKG